MCPESANSAKAAALSQRSAMAPSGEWQYIVSSRKGSWKVIVDPPPDSDQHQNLTTSRGSALARCLPCLVDIRKRVRELPVHRQADRQTDRDRQTARIARWNNKVTTTSWPVVAEATSCKVNWLDDWNRIISMRDVSTVLNDAINDYAI